MTHQEYFEMYCNYYKELQKEINKNVFILEMRELEKHVKRIGKVKTILNSYARYLYFKSNLNSYARYLYFKSNLTGLACACCIKNFYDEWGCVLDDKNDRSCPATYLCEYNKKNQFPLKFLSKVIIRNMVLSALRQNNVIAWRWLQ